MDTRAQFRKADFGDVEVEVNSHSMTSSRYVDRSRIGTHEEWQSSDNPMRMGRVVQVEDSLEDNARAGADAMKHRSSFRDLNSPAQRRGGEVCCSPFYTGYGGPLTTKRGDR